MAKDKILLTHARFLPAEEFLGQSFPPKTPIIKGLLHKRDLTAFAARRRHGKTSLLTAAAVALALPEPKFLGYEIPRAARSMLLLLEDDPGEYQTKLKRIVRDRSLEGRVWLTFRDEFYKSRASIDIRDPAFQETVARAARKHQPDWIVFDNLAHVVGAEYNDPKKIHELMRFCYELAQEHNCGITLAAHPRKDSDDHPVSLKDNPEGFFEAVMGSSHFVNSTGNLWGLERTDDYSVFVGGRQRGEGHQGHSLIEMDEFGQFHLVSELQANLTLVLNTSGRRRAWDLLPDPPTPFGYREGLRLVEPAMRSRSTYAGWMKECRRVGVIVDGPDGSLKKALTGYVAPEAGARPIPVNLDDLPDD